MHNHAWIIFVPDKFVKDLYGKYCSRGNGHVLVSGHPKDEIIFNHANNADVDNDVGLLQVGSNLSKRPIVFLWNIQFRDGAWSTWNEYGNKILDIFGKRDDLLLICRPHPFFFSSFENPSKPNYIKNKIINNKNTILDESTSMIDSFSKSDALLTDASSVIYHFWWTFKPMLYLRSERSENLHAHAFDLIKRYHFVGDDVDKIEDFVNLICHQFEINKNINFRLLPGFDEMLSPEGAGKRIAEAVINGISTNTIL